MMAYSKRKTLQVANSLNAQASAIAIRIHAGKREIQVIDNGNGIPKDMLRQIAEYSEVMGDQQQVYELLESNYLADVRRLSDCLTVASRHQYSKETFLKVLLVNLCYVMLLNYLAIQVKTV